MQTASVPLPPLVIVRPWPDPIVEAIGFGPQSSYIECCWLPVMGPTATWLYRRLGSLVFQSTDDTLVDLIDTAQSLGLGRGLSHQSMIGRALGRLDHFNAVRWTECGQLAVRRALPPLTPRQLAQASDFACTMHRQLVTGEPTAA